MEEKRQVKIYTTEESHSYIQCFFC